MIGDKVKVLKGQNAGMVGTVRYHLFDHYSTPPQYIACVETEGARPQAIWVFARNLEVLSSQT